MVSAAIEYHGMAGATACCIRAVERLLLHRTSIDMTRLLTSRDTHEGRHALLLATNDGPIAIRTGFTSGYHGEGPRGLARALRLLELHRVEVGEIAVTPDLLDRLDRCALTDADLKRIEGARPTFGPDVYDYIHPFEDTLDAGGATWHASAPSIPYAVLDPRLFDLALDFWADPDAALLKAFRRLETIVARRLEAGGVDPADKPGSKLFAAAFNEPNGHLTWPQAPSSVVSGRVSLFTGTYMAYRNARAHREGRIDERDALIELLAVNHLYLSEAQAVARADKAVNDD